MGRVKSEMFEDYLGPDDELVPKPLSQTIADVKSAIEGCELPSGSLERFEFMKTQLEELMNGIRTNLD